MINNQRHIIVHGVGSVSVVPDTVHVTIGVQTQDRTASGALTANNRRANTLIDTLKAHGVVDQDLQTSQLSINPTYHPTDNTVTGYQASNQLTATLRTLDNAGAVIDAAGRAAGDAIRVQQLRFSVADDTEPKARARAAAVHQGQRQAHELAEAAGVRLGPVRTITELPDTPPPRAMRVAAYSARESLPVEAGSQTIMVSVELVYDIG
jgi:uncharacterized protein